MNIWEIPEREETFSYINKKIREVAGATGMLETAYSWFRAGVMLTYLKEGALEDKSKSANVTFEKIVENMQKTIFFEENYDAQRRILAELLDMGEMPDLDISLSHIMFDERYALEEEAGLTHYRGKIWVDRNNKVSSEFTFGNNIFRRFETITGVEAELPKRSTAKSAGYDFFAPDDVIIPPSVLEDGTLDKPFVFKTGIKAKFPPDEVLMLYNRSSNPTKKGLVIPNSQGVIDSDYYNNPDNEGEIAFLFWNMSKMPVFIEKGEKIGQGVFQKFLLVDNDNATGSRNGGFGSTG